MAMRPYSRHRQATLQPFAVLAAIASLFTGCATQATVYRNRFAPKVEGRITSSDAYAVKVQLDDGGISIPRSDIRSIDHPGNVLAVAGVCVLLMGLQIIATEPHDTQELALTGAVIGLPGLTMLGWGGISYLRSKRAVAAFEDEGIRLLTERPYLPAPTWNPRGGAASRPHTQWPPR